MLSLSEKPRTGQSDALLSDGGAGTSQADLWATYAAVRTSKWIGIPISGIVACETASWIRDHQNADGGFAWQRGLPSDVWATFYCSSALRDLGQDVGRPDQLQEWIEATQTEDGGFAMTPGQNADVWATYYACRLLREICNTGVRNRYKLIAWSRGLQTPEGGITWAPGHRLPDVRAVYYAVHAVAAAVNGLELPWRIHRLKSWLRGMQCADGGFRFNERSSSCLWATFRATRTLKTVGWQPEDPAACGAWIRQRMTNRGFERWPGYSTTDVWANFSGVGALAALNSSLEPGEKALVSKAIQTYAVRGGGFTYRVPSAASDTLSTAARLLSDLVTRPNNPEIPHLLHWIGEAHMPWEDGFMYMPGRGAEVRCSLWAVSALRAAGAEVPDLPRLARWISELQNPDGGFGYWNGRGSDITSSLAAVSILTLTGYDPHRIIEVPGLEQFINECRRTHGAAPSPRASITASATAQTSRLLAKLGKSLPAQDLFRSLEPMALMGGYRENLKSPPSLYTTYQCVLAQQALVGNPRDVEGLARFLRKLVGQDGSVAWTPIHHKAQDQLASTLHTLLHHKVQEPSWSLPELVLTA